ncbi:MAG: DUF4397 domain-containing protein [Myxococcota bacterium]
MTLNKASLFVLALPVLIAGCPGDDTGGSGDEPTSSTTSPDPSSTTNPDPTDPDPTDPDPSSSTTEDPTDPDSSSSTTDDPPGDNAQVRVLHLGVRAPGVDLFANGMGPIIQDLQFREGTPYTPVPEGTYTFDISVTGTPVEDAVLSADLTLDANTSYTAVAIGDLEMTDGAPGLDVIALVDDAADIDAANIRVTAIHAAPAVGQVDIWEVTAEPLPLFENVDYGTFATLGMDVPAGPLMIGIDVDDDATPDLTFDVDATGLGGSQVNVFANNDENGDVALIIQLPTGDLLQVDPS